jgi:hypothetical protein
MSAVLYSHALRPLAIFALADHEEARLRDAQCIIRPVPHETDPTKFIAVPLVGERLRRGKHETFALFAADEADDELLYRHYGRD